jgi:hypothetical protein
MKRHLITLGTKIDFGAESTTFMYLEMNCDFQQQSPLPNLHHKPTHKRRFISRRGDCIKRCSNVLCPFISRQCKTIDNGHAKKLWSRQLNFSDFGGSRRKVEEDSIAGGIEAFVPLTVTNWIRTRNHLQQLCKNCHHKSEHFTILIASEHDILL